MMKYHITGAVLGVGMIQHVIRAIGKDDAWARFEAAHKPRKCTMVKMEVTS